MFKSKISDEELKNITVAVRKELNAQYESLLERRDSEIEEARRLLNEAHVELEIYKRIFEKLIVNAQLK